MGISAICPYLGHALVLLPRSALKLLTSQDRRAKSRTQPLSSAAKPHPPITVPVTCQGRAAVAVIDQIHAVAKHRLQSKIEPLSTKDLAAITRALSTILEIR